VRPVFRWLGRAGLDFSEMATDWTRRTENRPGQARPGKKRSHADLTFAPYYMVKPL